MEQEAYHSNLHTGTRFSGHSGRNGTKFRTLAQPSGWLMGSLVETLAEVECLIFVGYRVDGPPITLGKAETEGDRALKGLVFSNYVLSPSRVGIEELGVPGGDEGGWVKGASDIQGIDTSHQAN